MNTKNPGIAISIIIVNYNSGSLLKECIESIFSNVKEGFEIILYDNASSDDSVNRVRSSFPADPRITVMEGRENLGFAKANNLAAGVASGKYLHFLNPDIIVNAALSRDYDRIISGITDTVYVTSLSDIEGIPLKNRHLIPTLGNYLNRIFHTGKIAYWNIGASLVMSTGIFVLLEGWPEDYFMYAEDLDLFYRIHRKKLVVEYLDTRLVHIGQGSTGKVWNENERALRVELSFRKFYRKYGITWQYLILRPVQLVFILFHEPRLFRLQLKTFFRALFSKIP